MTGKVIRFSVGSFLIFLSIILLLFAAGPIVQAREPYIDIARVKTGSETDLSHPGQNLFDDDLETAWRFKAGSVRGWAELEFEQEILVYAVKLYGYLPSDAILSIEYEQDGAWIPFVAATVTTLPADGLLDLSLDRAVTKKIRLRLEGEGTANTVLNELYVLGRNADDVLHKIRPAAIEYSANTSPNYPAEFLNDGNTYTRWITKPSSHRGEVLFKLGNTYRLKDINIYFTNMAAGNFRIEVFQGTRWQEIGYLHGQLDEGWYRFELPEENITTGQVKLTVEGYGELGGIGEVEIWGFGKYEGKNRRTVGIQQPRPVNRPLTLSFKPIAEEQTTAPNLMAGAVKVLYKSTSTEKQSNSIQHMIRILNTGEQVIDLSDLKAKYWFSDETGQPQIINIYWASVGNNNIVTQIKENTNARHPEASHCLEIGFARNAGKLIPGGFVEIHLGINTKRWDRYDQSNDYSFLPVSGEFVENIKYAAYLRGEPAWGIEPVTGTEGGGFSTASFEGDNLFSYSLPQQDYGRLKVLYKCNTRQETANSIQHDLKLVNISAESVDLKEVKLRYWFTKEPSTPQKATIYWANIGADKVTSKFITLDSPVPGADCYLELGFKNGILKPGEEIEVKLGFNATDWADYYQVNDYTFDQTAFGYKENQKYTAYFKETLVWGEEPYFVEDKKLTDHELLLVFADNQDTAVNLEINGFPISTEPCLFIRGHALYSISLPAEILMCEENFIKIYPSGLNRILASVLIFETAGDGLRPAAGEGLTDGLLFTPALPNDGIIELGEITLLEEVIVTNITPATVRLFAFVDDEWVEMFPLEYHPHWQVFASHPTTDRLRLESTGELGEILLQGSPVTDREPVAKVLWPLDGEIIDITGWETRELKGFVDNPEAVVLVNGLPAEQNGHNFAVRLDRIGLRPWETTKITVTAKDAEDREGKTEIRVTLGQSEHCTIDQPDILFYTDKETFTISGTVQQPFYRVEMNGQNIPVQGKRFTTAVPLVEGFNLIKVQFIDTQRELVQTCYRRVVCLHDSKVFLYIDSPQPGTYLNKDEIVVSGVAEGLGELRVIVSGKPASLSGNRFISAPVALDEGENTIEVVATNGKNTVRYNLTVFCDRTPPEFTNIAPENNEIINTSHVNVSGQINDISPVFVYVNNKAAVRQGDLFYTQTAFSDGIQGITIQAEDIAGNAAVYNISIIVDTTPPPPFEVIAEPAGWTTNTQPVITFAATDETSGISHYEWAIDDGSYLRAESPLQLPPQPDGEHLVRIKAVDKAGWETVCTTKIYIDTTPPVAVKEFKGVPGKDKIIVSWKPNPENDIKEYVLRRLPSFPGGEEKRFGPGENEYIDFDVTNQGNYIYFIRAIDHVDNIGPETESVPVKPGVAVVQVEPSQETKVEYENVCITVPVDALPETKTLTIMEIEEPEQLLEKSLGINVTPVYTFSAATEDSYVDPEGVHFEKPVVVGVEFQLDGPLQYLKKSCLKAYYYNNKNENWEVIPESFVDGNTNTVYFFTNHFSVFSVQASVAPSLSPEQISSMGISPGQSYYQNNQVNISYASGSVTVTAKDFVLPGRGGLDLTISRTYDSVRAQADWGIEEETLFRNIFSFIDFGNPFFDLIANSVAKQIDRYMSGPAKTYGFGRGWRLNCVWVEKNDDGMFLHLPGGGVKEIDWEMLGPGWGGQGYSRFECHAGEHFILERWQEHVRDYYAEGGVKAGEEWRTTHYILTTKDGTKYHLNDQGLLEKVVNRLGTSEIKFFFKDKEKIDYIIDSMGRKIEFSYNSSGLITSISAPGKTVTYTYSNDELVSVTEGGLLTTTYDYTKHSLEQGSVTVSFINIIRACFDPTAWLNVIAGLIPDVRETDVYYLTSVTTPYEGEYKISYTEYRAVRYDTFFLGYGLMWYEFGRVTGFQEDDPVYDTQDKNLTINYSILYSDEEPPVIYECNVYEGKRRTYMVFERISNSVDKDLPVLKTEEKYGENNDRLSNKVYEYDRDLEVPVKIIDQTGNTHVVYEFAYDNWGNVIWQKNSHSKVEVYSTYANTNSPPLKHELVRPAPTGYANEIAADIHDLKTGELILNYQEIDGEVKIIPQQTWYKYSDKGNLLEKAVRYGDDWLRTSYEYDSYGNIIEMISPSGNTTYYEYSADYNHALLTRVILGKLTDADGQVRTNVVLKEIGYDPVTFLKRFEKDGRRYVTEYHHDAVGRLIMTVYPDDNDPLEFYPTVLTGEPARVGKRADNPYEQIIYKDAERTTTVIDPEGNRTDYIYDSFEKLVEIVKFQKQAGDYRPYSRTKIKYDDQGNISAIISPNGCADPDNAYKYTTSYRYDEMNRLKEIVYPDDTPSESDNPRKVYFYNDAANIETVIDENRHKTEVKKDPLGRIIEQITGVGSEEAVTIKFTYDALNNKLSETDGRNNTTLYEYDELNRLVKMILPETEVLNNPDAIEPQVTRAEYRYVYDYEGNLVEEVSPLGVVTTHVYDELNREIKTIVTFTNLAGEKIEAVTKIYYDLQGNQEKIVDPNDKTTKYTYTARGWVKSITDAAGGVTTFTYDKVGNKISETDPRGNLVGVANNSYTAWYFYDDLYRVVRAVLPDLTPPEDPLNPGDNPVLRFEYDHNGNCIKEIKPNGHEILYTYNGRNWLLEEIQVLDGQTYRTKIEYDKVGNKRFVYDNKNNKTECIYDPLNRLVMQINPENNTVAYGYDRSNNQVSVKDGNMNETRYVYDALNRRTKIIDANGGVTTFWYDAAGRVTQTVSPTNLVTKYYLNELGQPLKIEDSLGNTYLFDYEAAGNNIYKKDPRGTETYITYDDLYRVVQMELYNGNEKRRQFISYEYDAVGNVKKTANGQVTLVYNNYENGFRSDPFNRIHKIEQIMPDGHRYTTEYRYDLMGNMTGIRYPNSETWLDYEYDKMGRVSAIPGFAGTFTYDENSALAAVRMDNGITTTYNRDRNGRVTGIIANSLSGEDILNLALGYDAANNIVSRNDNAYIYDKVNRLQRATVRGNFEDKFTKADMILGTVAFDYFGDKEMVEEVTDQTQVKLDYAARSLVLNLLTEAENICRIELTPEEAGHRVQVDQIKIFYKKNEYFTVLDKERWTAVKDDQGRIIITFDPYLTATELKIHCNFDDLDYWQQPVDRSEFYNSPENLVTVYQKVKYRTESYEYDAMGNRTVERHLLRKEYAYYYEYYAKSNRLKTNGRFAYEYDANGNLIRKGNRYEIDGETVTFVTSGEGVEYWEYYYDLFNRLEEVKKNGETVARYLYDPNGFRVEKLSSKGKVHYVQLLNGEVGYRKEITVNKEYSFIYFAGFHLARVDGVIGGTGKKYFYHNDHLGSALVVTDQDGNKVIERDFLPFGEMINLQEGPNPYADGSGFTGKDWDEEIGLYYFNARWYDPEIGRFISQDPAADDPNLYSYGYNNPLKFVDPSGYWNVSINWSSFLTTSISHISPEAGDFLRTLSAFRGLVGTINDVQWALFLYNYTRMNERGFAAYLREKGINYRFIENNTSNYVFTNTEGQRALKQSMFASVLQKALIGDQKLSYFHAIEDNIEAFLKNNPGLSLEQVKGIFDSAVISAHYNEWGFGKNEFRYEGRGANYAGLYDAEAVVMNEGMIIGVFTRASTEADDPSKSIRAGVFTYEVGYHHMSRYTNETKERLYTDIYQEPAKYYDEKLEQYRWYTFGTSNTPIDIWYRGTYPALRIHVPGRTGIVSHAGMKSYRGSEGCPTMWQDDYLDYMNLFNKGERGRFIVIK